MNASKELLEGVLIDTQPSRRCARQCRARPNPTKSPGPEAKIFLEGYYYSRDVSVVIPAAVPWLSSTPRSGEI